MEISNWDWHGNRQKRENYKPKKSLKLKIGSVKTEAVIRSDMYIIKLAINYN